MARNDLQGRYRNPGRYDWLDNLNFLIRKIFIFIKFSFNFIKGWQVIDGTPQEKSTDGIMKMGPANVAANKVGDVNNNYDMGFLYSEVNAGKYYLINFLDLINHH